LTINGTELCDPNPIEERKRRERRERGLVFAGIVIINLLLADFVVQDILLRHIPESLDLASELIAAGYNLISMLLILGFLAYETSKAYSFLLNYGLDS
jgi:hypothetical protein